MIIRHGLALRRNPDRFAALVALLGAMGLAFALPGLSQPAAYAEPGDAAAAEPARDVETGQFLYEQVCAICHGGTGGGGSSGPPLRDSAALADIAIVEAFIRTPPPSMPAFYPGSLTDQDVRDIAAFVMTLQSDAQ